MWIMKIESVFWPIRINRFSLIVTSRSNVDSKLKTMKTTPMVSNNQLERTKYSKSKPKYSPKVSINVRISVGKKVKESPIDNKKSGIFHFVLLIQAECNTTPTPAPKKV